MRFRALYLLLILVAAAAAPSFAGGTKEGSQEGGTEKAESGQGEEAGDQPASPASSAPRNPKRGSDGVLEEPGVPPVEFHKKFATDFGRSTVYFDSIISGGPPKDGIPSIDSPVFTEVTDASVWIGEREPVLLLMYKGIRRVYPLQILMWHEIVNDEFDGEPVLVTYCPLTTTIVAYRSLLDDGTRLEFGATGRLRFSNLVMYDRQTESWWQQATGQGIVGRYAGDRLSMIPLQLVPWSEILKHHPGAEVLARESGYISWPYGKNPYEGYDRSKGPFLYRGPDLDPEEDLMGRVAAVRAGEEIRGFLYSALEKETVVSERIGGREVVLFRQPGMSSPVDAPIVAAGRDIGAVGAFYPEVAGRKLSFLIENNEIRDRETGSRWSLSGLAVEGKLEGTQLDSPVMIPHFVFSWNAFEEEYEK
jgi:hypothetical protein